jgi:transcriptional regulator with XRE-family HTH domain
MEVAIIPSAPGPLVRRRQLGAALRQHRIDAGLSLSDAARQLLCSPSKISRIESAQRNISARDVRDLIGIYRLTDPAVRKNLMRLVEESREAAWWGAFDLFPSSPAYERLIGLEAAATTIHNYEIGAIPGILQTPEYSAAVVGAWTDDRAVIQNAVEVRAARQRFMSADTQLNFVVDESAFRRPVGGAETMRAQILKLIGLGTGTRISFQVIPFSAGAHQGMVTGFIVLQFSNSISDESAAGMSDVVYLEGVVEPAFLDQPDEVDGYLKAFRTLQSKALSPQETLSFLQGVLRDL